MSARQIIQAIETQSVENDGGAYELEIQLKSGRQILCAPYKSGTYFLKVSETVTRSADSSLTDGERISYIPYEAIEQVTPIWL